jgi:hypothetical protein
MYGSGLTALLYDLYGESILVVAAKTCWQMKVLHVCTPLSCQRDFLVLPGFAPAGELVAWRGPKAKLSL